MTKAQSKEEEKKQARQKALLAKKNDPLILARPRNFGIGHSVQPKRDLTRYVRWPRYIRLQRQRAVLYKRLKIPPTINQFKSYTLDRQTGKQLATACSSSNLALNQLPDFEAQIVSTTY